MKFVKMHGAGNDYVYVDAFEFPEVLGLDLPALSVLVSHRRFGIGADGVVTLDEKDRILRMTEKSPTPETHWCCPPFYFYKQEDIARVGDAIAEGCGVDAPGSFVAWLAEKVPVHAMEMPGSRYDIGNLESYQKVQREYNGITK